MQDQNVSRNMEILEQAMREQENQKAGAVKVRQIDVARAAGVSPGTVSKILNGERGISQKVRAHVLSTMQEMGFPLPVSHRDGSPARRICLITYFQYLAREHSYFHSEVIQSIQDEAGRQEIEVVTLLLNRDFPNDLAEYRRRLAESQADAVLFVGIDAPDYLSPVRELGIPGVIVNGNDPEFAFDSIAPALRDGCKAVTRHLIALGHRDIVHITHLYRNFIHQRLDGFREAMEEAGLPFSMERNVMDVGDVDERMFTADQASDVIYQKIMDGSLRATALFCVSDYTAFGAIQAIQRAGKRVPEDYSVASFDNLPLAQLCCPRITSAGVDRGGLGVLAVQRVQERLRSPLNPVLRIEVGVALALRESTAVSPAG